MQKVVNSGNEVMDKIKAGIDLVANPVISTIGPKGKTVIIAESYVADYNLHSYPVTVTKDGYRVSRSISSSDPQIQVGVRLIQEAAEKTMNDCGDATSTTCLLTQAILEGGLEFIKAGASPIEVKKGIEFGVEYVVSELKKMSTPINEDVEKIRQVATVCSNNDEIIGGLIAEAFSKIGVDGMIDIEEAKGRETSIKISDGIKFNRGWASQYFVTNKAKAECVLENPLILIYDRPLTIIKDLMPFLERFVGEQQVSGIKRPLMIFCDAADGEPLATLTFNNTLFHAGQGGFQSCVVEMAFLGQYKRDFMEDIAAATRGVFINELKGTKLENVEIQQLGQAQKIVIGKEETTIIGGIKDEKIFNNLVESIKALETKEEDLELKGLLKKRIARLKGSVAILAVGATTELEMKEKKDRVDDAVRATRAALEEGYVTGGGSAFIRIHNMKIKFGGTKTIEEINEQPEALPAIKAEFIIYNSLKTPLAQICINAGIPLNNGDLVGLLINEKENIGYNAKTGIVEDLVLAGIIEPTKSNRCALQNAASVVCAILTSSFMITDTL